MRRGVLIWAGNDMALRETVYLMASSGRGSAASDDDGGFVKEERGTSLASDTKKRLA